MLGLAGPFLFCQGGNREVKWFTLDHTASLFRFLICYSIEHLKGMDCIILEIPGGLGQGGGGDKSMFVVFSKMAGV